MFLIDNDFVVVHHRDKSVLVLSDVRSMRQILEQVCLTFDVQVLPNTEPFSDNIKRRIIFLNFPRRIKRVHIGRPDSRLKFQDVNVGVSNKINLK
ncbi:hypothetical protein NY2A_b782R [Paramecium bursaria Chlorella virus NY2A]|uniref:Uncharacterized protein b782R n=1 Tax=Paramecium bursaria Chlorella virus NY2A TaxID=46021 RepID=A7IXV7_PBCVN|nr:hypothetical protein NY2A_b782R [Paramecium bursaria Chlorella virus NY2A]ABT15181.1 hypothetical protein NY2A_b782R [Paramecium bursaria Chlorella virus NY2A]